MNGAPRREASKPGHVAVTPRYIGDDDNTSAGKPIEGSREKRYDWCREGCDKVSRENERGDGTKWCTGGAGDS